MNYPGGKIIRRMLPADIDKMNDFISIIKAVAECDPWQENDVNIERYCFFCDEPEHRKDCLYILARKIMEDG